MGGMLRPADSILTESGGPCFPGSDRAARGGRVGSMPVVGLNRVLEPREEAGPGGTVAPGVPGGPVVRKRVQREVSGLGLGC